MNARTAGRSPRRVLAMAVLSMLVLLGGVAPAAATGDEHAGGLTGCLARLDARVAYLGKLLQKVGNAYDVTPEHRATLTTTLQDAKAGLLALRGEIEQLGVASLSPQHEDPAGDGALTSEQAAACERVVHDFRVYALRQPQVHLVLAADRVTGQRALFDLLGSDLEAAIAAVPGDPDVAEARGLLDSYRAHIDAAWNGAAGVGDAVVGLGVADWNANHEVLCPYRDAMHEVKGELRAAKKDARKIIALLSDGATKA